MASHPPRMRKALGSNPSVSTDAKQRSQQGSVPHRERGMATVPSFRAPSLTPSSPAAARWHRCHTGEWVHADTRIGLEASPTNDSGAQPRSPHIVVCPCLPVKVHTWGTWCSGITSASHAEGPGLKTQCVHAMRNGAEQTLAGGRGQVLDGGGRRPGAGP